MAWPHFLPLFFGGAFLANAVPHLVAGMLGRPFQTPFAKPPGQGLSSSTVNVLWGFFNLVVAYVLLCRVGTFAPSDTADIITSAAGAFVISVFAARHFGRFHGGNVQERP